VSHPWELTLRQFVERVRRDYGIVLRVSPLRTPGSLLGHDKLIYVLPGIAEDDLLDIEVLESICQAFLLPRSDFHLDPEDEEDED
jgi:hypothetical protein